MESTPSTLDWSLIGKRLQNYCVVMGISADDLEHRCGLPVQWITRTENGAESKSLEHLWAIIKSENISINWLFHGIGECFGEDPPEILPETIIRHRACGIRRSKERFDAEEGQIVGDSLEFVLAVDAYKRRNSIPFPTLTEMFELFYALGYRKIAQQTINPKKECQA